MLSFRGSGSLFATWCFLLFILSPTVAQSQAPEKTISITAKEEDSFQRYSTFVSSVAFAPDGKRIASAGGNRVKVTSLETGKDVLKLKNSRGMSFFSVAFSPNGRYLAGGQGQLKSRKTESRNDERITTYFYRGEVLIWNAQTGTLITKLNHNYAPAWHVAFSPDERWLAIGSGPLLAEEKKDCEEEVCEGVGTILLYDTNNWKLVAQLRTDAFPVRELAFSPDGKWLASSSGISESTGSTSEPADFVIFLWDVARRTVVQKLEGHSRPVTALAFSADGKRFASASRDRSLKVWDTQTWEVLYTSSEFLISYEELEMLAQATGGKRGKEAYPKVSWLNALTFSRDGKHIIGGGGDGIVRFYDAESGKLLHVLKPRDWPIWGWDQTWDWSVFSLPQRAQLRPWPTYHGTLNSMALSRDGTMLATGNKDGKIRLLSLE
jgi:WD40 repeat protein